MKSVISSLLFLVIISPAINAQNGGMDIMATVVNPDSVHSIDVKISVPSGFDGEFLEISLFDGKSGVVVISGRPYSKFDLAIPSESELRNQFGESAHLQNLRLMKGENRDVESMDVLTPATCSELMIPESGRVYLRVGGTVESEDSLRGFYLGKLNFDCADR